MDQCKITPAVNLEGRREHSLYLPPPIYYSLYAASRFAILLAQPQTHDWFYSNFIQLHFDDRLKITPDFTEHYLQIFPVEYMKSWYYNGATLFLQEKLINDKIMAFDPQTLISDTIKWIEREFYVITRLDVSKIPGTIYYQGPPQAHTVFFYGYDLQSGVFKHLDFNENGDLKIIPVKFEDYQAAFFSAHLPGLLKAKKINSGFHITLCNVKSSIRYQLDPDCIITLLSDYLNSVNTTKRFNLFVPEVTGIYGMHVYQALIDFVQTLARDFQEIDYRAFHALYEHKTIMVERLRHLEKHGLLDESLKLPERFGAIVELTDLLRHRVLKYELTKNNLIINEIVELLQNVYDREKPLIEAIIAGLEKR